MEVVAGLTLFVASFLGNYEMLYRTANLDDFLRYDNFIMIAFSLFQLLYLIALFLNWYFSYFEIKNAEIIRKSGIIFHSRKSYLLQNVISIGTEQSPMDRVIGHATILLENKNGSTIRLRNVPNYQEYLSVLKRTLNADKRSNFFDIRALIEQGENKETEFKETLRVDARSGALNKDLEKAVLKSIVGFMNADGGNLLIGVKDGGEVVGIERDINTLPKKNRDGFENHLNSLMRAMIGVNEAKQTQVYFQKIGDKDLCAINVEPLHRPAYLKFADKEEFFVRVGNSTRALSMSEAEEYIRSRFN